MREVILIIGQTGYGKSVWLRQYCESKTRIFAYDPFGDFVAEYMDSEQLVSAYDQSRFLNGNSFRVGSTDLSCIDLLGSLAFESGNSIFVLEECAYVFDKGERIPPWLSDIVFLGRKRSVSLIATAQRASSVPIDLRSQASRLVSFAQHENQDISWLQNYFGDRVNELSNFPPLECLDASNGSISRYRISV